MSMSNTNTITMFAGVTAEGVAAAETALCGDCDSLENAEMFYVDYRDTITHREDCTENDALECQNCGAVAA